MIINIDDHLAKRIVSLANEYDNMIENEENDFHDIGDDCINVVCRLADLIKINDNPNITRIDNSRLKVYHWEFFVDNLDEYTINVYEIRSGDVIGTLGMEKTLPEIEQTLNNFSEEEVFKWIDNNIEHI